MIDDRYIRAAHNNAELCDAVCRAHGSPGEFRENIWLCRHPMPRFYPNAVTLAPPNQQQLDLIDELLAMRLPPGWAIKDSFASLDLASRGFHLLFTAAWIYLPVSRMKEITSAATSARWEVVRNARALTKWESAWAASSGDTSTDRIFLPPLIERKDIAVVAGYRDNRIVAGAIANRSDVVVGLSNFFAPANEALTYAAESVVAIGEAFPALSIVGYEQGDELRNAQALGFESLGPLRVWIFQS
jgi:hypothetical protein